MSLQDDVIDTSYILSHDEIEKQRLQRQHIMLERFFGREDNIVPLPIPLDKISNVLDVAAGTLVWTLHLASMPEVAPRLSPSSANPIHLYACDLTSEKFPASSVTDPLGIKLFEHDMTMSFPEEYRGKFDLINMKMLIVALSERGWEKALKNIHELLKPGGFLLLRELNGHDYAKEEVVSEEESQVSLNVWTYPVNRLWRRDAELNHHVPDLAVRLPAMVKSAGYSVVYQITSKLPFGALCRTEPGALGQPVTSEEDFSAEIFLYMLNVLSKMALKGGYLEGSDGKTIDTESGRQQLIHEMRKMIQSEGVFVYGTELIVQRAIDQAPSSGA